MLKVENLNKFIIKKDEKYFKTFCLTCTATSFLLLGPVILNPIFAVAVNIYTHTSTQIYAYKYLLTHVYFANIYIYIRTEMQTHSGIYSLCSLSFILSFFFSFFLSFFLPAHIYMYICIYVLTRCRYYFENIFSKLYYVSPLNINECLSKFIFKEKQKVL